MRSGHGELLSLRVRSLDKTQPALHRPPEGNGSPSAAPVISDAWRPKGDNPTPRLGATCEAAYNSLALALALALARAPTLTRALTLALAPTLEPFLRATVAALADSPGYVVQITDEP